MALKLIGAGLGRTGTLSMKVALEDLGFGPCYHMAEILADPMTRLPPWKRVLDGQPDWDAVFGDFVSTVDYPACTYWRELAAAYPDARVLLTVRDPDKWFESTQATIFSPESLGRLGGTAMANFLDKTVWGSFGSGIHDRDFMVDAFRRHNAEVENAIPPDRLLVHEVGEGWSRLCDFLGVDAPSTPFPHANSREEMQANILKTLGSEKPMSLEELSSNVRARLASLRSRPG